MGASSHVSSNLLARLNCGMPSEVIARRRGVECRQSHALRSARFVCPMLMKLDWLVCVCAPPSKFIPWTCLIRAKAIFIFICRGERMLCASACVEVECVANKISIDFMCWHMCLFVCTLCVLAWEHTSSPFNSRYSLIANPSSNSMDPFQPLTYAHTHQVYAYKLLGAPSLSGVSYWAIILLLWSPPLPFPPLLSFTLFLRHSSAILCGGHFYARMRMCVQATGRPLNQFN